MLLTAVKILDLNEKYSLVTNLSKRELENPEGVGLDIRLGEVYELEGEGFLGVEFRETPNSKLIGSVKKEGEGFRVKIKPNKYYLVKTQEIISSPSEKVDVGLGFDVYLVPLVFPRGTLHRSGLFLRTAKTDPGYKGELIFGLKNESDCDIEIELGSRFANLVYECAFGELSRKYEGQWQEGRVSTKGVEKQN